MGEPQENGGLTFGKGLHLIFFTSPFFYWQKLTVEWTIFNSYLTDFQRVVGGGLPGDRLDFVTSIESIHQTSILTFFLQSFVDLPGVPAFSYALWYTSAKNSGTAPVFQWVHQLPGESWHHGPRLSA